jgi:hypothetical protein
LPILVGDEGYLVNLELCNGSDHYQKNTVVFLQETLLLARRLTTVPILLRLDSRNDTEDNLRICFEKATRCQFIIKHNLRRESPEEWHELAKAEGILFHHVKVVPNTRFDYAHNSEKNKEHYFFPLMVDNARTTSSI